MLFYKLLIVKKIIFLYYKKIPPKWDCNPYQALFNLVYLLKNKNTQTARVAPDEFANTSNKSPFLVFVNNSCAISIPVPKKTDIKNDITKGLKIVALFK